MKKCQGREILWVSEAAASSGVNIWEAPARWTHRRLFRDIKLLLCAQGVSNLVNYIPHKTGNICTSAELFSLLDHCLTKHRIV